MELIEVKCPFQYVSKSDGKDYLCDRVCVKVTSGSSGEAWCRYCRKVFDFKVESQTKQNKMAKMA